MSQSNTTQSAQPGRITYAEIYAACGDGPRCPKWTEILAMVEDRAESVAHYRELIAAYKAHREPIERVAFKARAARGGFHHVGNSGRV